VRKQLGIPLDAPVLLTIGSAYKYDPVAGMNFFDTIRAILQEVSDAYLIAIGPQPDHPHWAALHHATAGRVMPLGEQPHLRPYHLAADVYVEGFPFGSFTAFLEAGLAGLPCVMAPPSCPILFRSDGRAIDQATTPLDMAEYVRGTVALLRNSARRRQLGHALAHDIAKSHCGTHWTAILTILKQQLPDQHHTHPLRRVARLPLAWEHYLPHCLPRQDYSSVDFAWQSALNLGLEPHIDFRLQREMVRARSNGGMITATPLSIPQIRGRDILVLMSTMWATQTLRLRNRLRHLRERL